MNEQKSSFLSNYLHEGAVDIFDQRIFLEKFTVNQQIKELHYFYRTPKISPQCL
jgi:hypothetical protein